MYYKYLRTIVVSEVIQIQFLSCGRNQPIYLPFINFYSFILLNRLWSVKCTYNDCPIKYHKKNKRNKLIHRRSFIKGNCVAFINKGSFGYCWTSPVPSFLINGAGYTPVFWWMLLKKILQILKPKGFSQSLIVIFYSFWVFRKPFSIAVLI